MERNRRRVKLGRFDAAMRANGYDSREAVGRAAGVGHSVLASLAKGAARESNPATIAKLAEALRVPEEWLTGQVDDLPLVNNRSLLTGRKIDPPTAGMIRRSWLLQRVEKAVRRDLRVTFESGAGFAYDSWGYGILIAVAQLADAYEWRCAAIVPTGNPITYLLETNSPRRRGARGFLDETVSIAWVEQMLEPWLAGVAALNSDTLGSVLEALFLNLRRSEVYPPAARKVLDKRDEAAKEALVLYGACFDATNIKRANALNAAVLKEFGVTPEDKQRQ